MQIRCVQVCQRHCYILQTVSHAAPWAGTCGSHNISEFEVFEASAMLVLGSGGWQWGLSVEGSLLSEQDLAQGKSLILREDAAAQFGVGMAESHRSRRATQGAERVLGPNTLFGRRVKRNLQEEN